MTVETLIEMLQGFPADAEVICQSDPEGNGHSPLHSMWLGAYRAETTWSGVAGLLGLDAADRDAGYTEEDVLEDGVKAVFLVPVN